MQLSRTREVVEPNLAAGAFLKLLSKLKKVFLQVSMLSFPMILIIDLANYFI